MIALISEFKKELSSVSCFAEITVKNYVSCVLVFIEYCKDILKVEPIKCEKYHILGWLIEVKKSGVCNGRMQNHRSALKNFYAYLLKHKLIKENPADVIPFFRKKRSERDKPIPTEVAYKLLRFIDRSSWFGRRNYLMISIFWALGLRLKELITLRVKSFEPCHGYRIGLLRIKGKNRKERALFVVDKLYDTLVDYLGDPKSPQKKNAPLFPIEKGTAISASRVQKIIKQYSEEAGIKERVRPHVLRHTFATDMYLQNVPLSAIQSMLGHAKIAETSIYIHVSDDLQKQALELISLSEGALWQ